MIRIGVTQRVENLADRNERRDCLDQEWSRLLLAQQMVPIPLPNRSGDAALLLDQLQLSGLILSGGNDLADLPGATNVAPERDAFEQALLSLAATRRIPVLGVCRGLQMMVTASGGHLIPVEGHVARAHPLEVYSEDPTIRARSTVNSFHNFGVDRAGLGPQWQVLATAPDGTVEAIAHHELPQVAIMWHPERAPHDPQDARLIRHLFATSPSNNAGAST